MVDDEKCHAWPIAGISITLLLSQKIDLYQQTALYLTGFWNQYVTGNCAYGYLVLAICAYLIIYNRRLLASLIPCPGYRVLLAVLIAYQLWLLVVIVGADMTRAVGLLLLVTGNQIARALAFPYGSHSHSRCRI